MKKLISIFIALCVVMANPFSFSVFAENEIKTITANRSNGDTGYDILYKSTNRWSEVIQSYIFQDKDNEFSVFDVGYDGINVDTYDMSYKQIRTKSIPMELELFGGFYSGENYNYIVFGQENMEEDDSKEVIRVVKYDKSFKRISACAVTDCYTTIPFDAGSLRMAEYGSELTIHTTRQRYLTPDDGLRHQSQLTIVLDTNTMKVTNQLVPFQNNHVSHSFNQFVQYYNGKSILIDHGDAYPRAVVLNKCRGNYNRYEAIKLFQMPGDIGANCTGITVGGFEISKNNFIVAINTIDHNKATDYDSFRIYGLDKDERNIMLLISDHSNTDTNKVKKVYLTDYIGKNKLASTPYLVKLSDERFMVMWEEFEYSSNRGVKDNGVKFIIVDEDGKAIYTTKEDKSAVLSSDCQPTRIGNNIVWYRNTSNKRIFYIIDLDKDKQQDTSANDGDVNGDGRVTALDNAYLARYLAKWTGYDETNVNLIAADTNGDGKVTALDNAVLARYLAKWTGYDTLPYVK